MNLRLSIPEAVAKLKHLIAATPEASTRAMFRQTACFIDGMAGGTWGATFMLRLSLADRAAPDLAGCTLFDPMGGRPMSEYRVLPVDLDEADVADWLRRALAYTLGLPPKAPKAPKSARPAG
ncbi:MAG: hypothetical protein EXR69_09845 [Myxococcales bacterium]|nr:hypothetical protein [Myxococcales bacterium]